jgi:hypothetical protein
MTRRISSYISVLLTAALTLVSCEKEAALDSADSQTLTICLSPADMELTRAESEYGSEDYNENAVNNFKLYFYTEDSETATAAYIYPDDNSLASLTNESAAEYTTNRLTKDPSTGKVTLKIALDKTVGRTLFPSGTASKCYVYAVANTGSLVTLPSTVGDDATSKQNLKALGVTASFGPDDAIKSDPYAAPQTDFVMDGSAELTIDSNQNATGTVELSRAAAKITFYITQITNVFEKDASGNVTGIWTADVDNMRVAYKNTVNYGHIGSETASAERDGQTASYTSSQGRLLTYESKNKAVVKSKNVHINSTSTELADSLVTLTDCTHSLPFYSYYDKWTSSGDAAAPYLLVQIPWKYTKQDGSGTRYFTCYYAVPFNSVSCTVERNTWYKVSLSVSILGSGDPENPTDITPSYMVLPWGSTPVQTNANLKRYKYLLVDQNSYVMDNVNTLEIPFYSSNEVEIVDAAMTKTVLKPSSGYQPYEQTVSSGYTITPDNSKLPGKSTVTFTHTLENDYSEDYDVTAYTITFTVQHKGDTNYQEKITITQYPALYVVASLNSDCKDPTTVTTRRGTTTSGTNLSGNYDHYGYLYINGRQSASAYSSRNGRTSVEWPIVSDQSNVGNTDPYMYVVTVSSLPAGTSYIIGDPRTAEPSVPSFGSSYYISSSSWNRTAISQWATANDMDGTSRQLKYYYPADTDGTRVNNMIAPSFRIASSYGVVGVIDYDGAVKRCASYQEDGYPAGRWRVPTAAEIAYMVKLAYDEKIPVLLSSSSYYWGSNKSAYKPDGKGGITSTTETDNTHVRCVYDEWYWTDKCDVSTFTWGDKER